MSGKSRLWLATSFALVLIACGDGGGDTGTAGTSGGGSGGAATGGRGGATTGGTSGSGGTGGSSAGAGGSAGTGGSSAGTGGGAGTGGTAAGTGGRGGATAGTGGGAAGSGGNAGGGGAAGAAGNAGAGGRGGTGGAAGSAGAGGRGGSGGAAGNAGAGGRGGSGGAAGNAGAGGRGGSGGAAGAGGAATFRPCPTNGDACRILPLGDSITDGFNIAGGYRIELFRRAHMAGQNITFTGSLTNGPAMVDGVTFPNRHEGHSGWTISMIADQVPSPALQTVPHIVLLMAGTNDAIMNLTIAQAPTRLGALIDELTTGAPNALIVVAQLTPLSDAARESRVTGFNAALPALVQTRVDAGKHVVLVNMHTVPTSELADGIHPNQAGYDRMGGIWYAAIDPVLP